MNCRTISEAIASLETLEELEGLAATLRDATIKTKPVSKEDWEALAQKRIEWTRTNAATTRSRE